MPPKSQPTHGRHTVHRAQAPPKHPRAGQSPHRNDAILRHRLAVRAGGRQSSDDFTLIRSHRRGKPAVRRVVARHSAAHGAIARTPVNHLRASHEVWCGASCDPRWEPDQGSVAVRTTHRARSGQADVVQSLRISVVELRHHVDHAPRRKFSRAVMAVPDGGRVCVCVCVCVRARA